MTKALLVGVALLALMSCEKPRRVDQTARETPGTAFTVAAETVIIGTSDGKKIFADHVAVDHARATIVLFHQADSSAYEYRDIAHRLNEAGYSTLAVDQRSGGTLYGPNRTVNKYGTSSETYIDALPDMVAALNWARLQRAPVILMGSSYSASLSLQVAAENPGLVAAVLALSPGEYFDDKHYVRSAAAKVTMPIFITQADDELPQSRLVFDAIPGDRKTLFIPRLGSAHGAASLRADRNSKGAEKVWKAVRQFLENLKLEPN